MNNKRLLNCTITMLFATGANYVLAAPVDFSIEGKLQNVIIYETPIAGAIGLVQCNGSQIYITSTTRITSPTTQLSIADLKRNAALPGRGDIKDFDDGTCIIDGVDDDSGSVPIRIASDVYVEVAENVVVGPIGVKAADGGLNIMDVPVKLLKAADGQEVTDTDTDTQGRIVANAPKNGYGFEVNLELVPGNARSISSAEGYLAKNPKTDQLTLYAHDVEVDYNEKEALLSPSVNNDKEISNMLASVGYSGNTAKFEIRGGCLFPAAITGANRLVGFQYQTATGWSTIQAAHTAQCARDATDTSFGLYRIRPEFNIGTARPTQIKIGFVTVTTVNRVTTRTMDPNKFITVTLEQ